jgi:nucleoside-diphosphate-sugar epimerase
MPCLPVFLHPHRGRQMTTILVTGAAGFVGRHLIDALKRKVPGAVVIGLDRDPEIPPRCDRRIVCDLTHTRVFQALDVVGPIDRVIHLAAQSFVHFSLKRPDIYVQDNVLATSNLLQALAGQPSLKRFVLVSSCEVYGDTQSPAAETHPLKPRTPYAASKLAQEYFALSAIEHQRLPAVICRLFNNYGAGQQSNRLIPRIMETIRSAREFELIGDGSQKRDWVAVEDTCDALIRLLCEPKIRPGRDIQCRRRGGVFGHGSSRYLSGGRPAADPHPTVTQRHRSSQHVNRECRKAADGHGMAQTA